jgi:hypothetical protein
LLRDPVYPRAGFVVTNLPNQSKSEGALQQNDRARRAAGRYAADLWRAASVMEFFLRRLDAI